MNNAASNSGLINVPQAEHLAVVILLQHLRSPELENTLSLFLSPSTSNHRDRQTWSVTTPHLRKNLSLLLNPHQVVRVLHMCRIYLSVPQQTCVLSQGQQCVIVLINLSLWAQGAAAEVSGIYCQS